MLTQTPTQKLDTALEELQRLREQIHANPLAFYEQTGVDYILALKELQVFGRCLLESASIQAKVKHQLKQIPIENL